LVVKLDFLETLGPNEQGVWAVRGPVIAMTTSFDNKSDAAFPRKIDRLSYILGVLRGYGVDASLRYPGVKPTQGLSECGAIAD
jgi:hypothetical protein